MNINPKIDEALLKSGMNIKDGKCYLISFYFDVVGSYTPPYILEEISKTGIIKSDGMNYIWNIPLFTEPEKDKTPFDWVETEYVAMFKEKNPTKGKYVRESKARMKELFASNPEIRKDDVIEATRLYLHNTDANFIRFPHFFIKKGAGATKIQDILTWIDTYKDSDLCKNRQSTSNTMK